MGNQVYSTAGSFTFNWPTGVTVVVGEAIGGGGGGGIASGNPATGGGGRGGYYAKAVITKGAEASLAVTVGAGGISAGNGVSSTVVQSGTTRILACGGGAGGTGSAASSNGAGGTGVVGAATGDSTWQGGSGGTGNFTAGVGGSGGGGGAATPGANGNAAIGNSAGSATANPFLNGSTYGATGAAGVGNSTDGLASNPYGGGASGGKANTNTDRAGGVGGRGVVVFTWHTPVQNLFRIYADDAAPATATALASEGTSVNVIRAGSDTLLQIRFRIQNTVAVGGASTDDYQIYVQKNGAGGYAQVTSSGDVRIHASSNFAEGDAITQRLTAGTGSYVTGKASEDGEANDLDITASNYTELVFAVKAGSAGTVGDVYDFRVYKNGAALDNYTLVPRVTLIADSTPPTTVLNTTDETTFYTTTPTLEATATDNLADNVSYLMASVGPFETANLVDSVKWGLTPLSMTMTSTITGQIIQGNGGTLGRVVIPMGKAIASGGTITARVYAITGTPGSTAVPTGTALAISDTVNVSSLPDVTLPYMQLNPVVFNFSGVSQITLTNGTWYAIGVDLASKTGGAPFSLRSGSSIHGGNMFEGTVGGSLTPYSGFDYGIYVLTTAHGTVTVLGKVSGTDAGFANTVTGGDTDPFNSGEKVSYTHQSALGLGLYEYTFRAKDPTGSNIYGSNATWRRFTVATPVFDPVPITKMVQYEGILTQ